MAIYFPDEDIRGLDLDLVELLDNARKLSGVTFYIDDFRDIPMEDKNISVNLKCTDDHARFHIVRSLLIVGIDRIWIYPDYIRLEYGKEPKNRLFIGK